MLHRQCPGNVRGENDPKRLRGCGLSNCGAVTGVVATTVGRRARLAVVEDDDEFRERILVPRLQGMGFVVDGMSSALALYRAMVARTYDIVLLDVGLPDESGYSIASHLRTRSPSMGIVMLSGHTSQKEQKRGLKAGVDAYLTKPLDAELLSATLRNLLRRIDLAPDLDRTSSGWRLDETGWRIVAPTGEEILMSLAERQVMRQLAATPGMAVRRESLIAKIAEDAHDFDPHRLEMLVYRLRKRCLKMSGADLPLHAVRGMGYVLSW